MGSLPTEFLPFGHVVGRVGGPGLVRFTPAATHRVVTSTVPDSWVAHEVIAADLDADGVLAVGGHQGVSLYPGVWTVSPGSPTRFDFPAFTIEVTAAHTAADPLEVWSAAPWTPGPGDVVTTLVVPPGPIAGQSLGWDGSQLAWVTPTITPTVTTLAAGSDATAAMSGSWPNLTLGLGIPAGQPSAYQIVGTGRPDIPASMTTAVQAQVAAATVGTTFISTDGPQGAWAWRRRTTGWQVIDGDTGWRRLYNGNPANWDAYASNIAGLDVRRSGSTMHARICGSGMNMAWSRLQVCSKVEQPLNSAMPAGMAPPGRLWAPMMFEGAYTGGVLIKSTSWFLSVTVVPQTEQLASADVQWPEPDSDSAWPTTLPGTAA